MQKVNDVAKGLIDGERQRTNHQRVTQGKLLCKLGTEVHKFHTEDQEWRARLDSRSRDRLRFQGQDTANLGALFGLSRRGRLQLKVPQSISLVLDDPDSYPELAAALMDSYVPRSSDDGASIARNDAYVGLANEASRVREFWWDGIRQALHLPGNGYRIGGMRLAATVVIETFAGGNTGSGLLPAEALLARDVAREKGIDIYLAAHLTLPDTAPGFDANVLQARRAKTMALLLEIAALEEQGHVVMQIGDKEIDLRGPFIDEVVLYSHKSSAGVITEIDDLTHTMTEAVRLHLEDGTGVGQALRQNRVRLTDVLHRQAPHSEHQALFSVCGYGKLILDRDLLARGFARRSTLELVQGLTSSSEQRAASSLFSRLTEGNPELWVRHLAEALRGDLPPIRAHKALSIPLRSEEIDALETDVQHQWERQRKKLHSRASDLRRRLNDDLSGQFIQIMSDVRLRDLVDDLGKCRARLIQLASALEERVGPRLKEAQNRHNSSKENLTAGRWGSDEELQNQITAFQQAVQGSYRAKKRAEVGSLLGRLFRGLAEQLSDWRQRASTTVEAIAQQVEHEGAYERMVREDPIWAGTLNQRPCERFLLEPTETNALYDQLQPLYRRTDMGERHLRSEAVTRLAEGLAQQSRSRLLLEGEAKAFLEAVEAYFYDLYMERLRDYAIPDVMRAVHGDLSPLRGKLEWAFEVAQGYLTWIDIGSRTRHLHHHTVVELSVEDAELEEMIEQIAPREYDRVRGDRGEMEMIVITRAVHGLHLGLVPEFREGGSYWEAYVERQRNWLMGRGVPVHASPALEKLVMEQFPALARAVGYTGGEA